MRKDVDTATTVILTDARHVEVSKHLAEANLKLERKVADELRDVTKDDLLEMYREVYKRHAPEWVDEVERALK